VQQLAPVSRAFLLLGYLSALLGRRTVNAEPLPGSLVIVTSPPIMLTSYLARGVREIPNRAVERQALER
jgi:hypothetical protein